MLFIENVTTNKSNSLLGFNVYREQLLRYLEDYQINLSNTADIFSENANKKAKIVIAHEFNPNDIELKKDLANISDEIGAKTREIIRLYMRNIMFILGSICECIIIDNCKRNPILNMKCINYACFKKDINEEYNDINYNQYTPFSPSHKRIVLYSEAGIIHYAPNRYVFEPNHINKDIIWCNKDSLEDILKAKIPFTQYELQAKIQVKASTNYQNIDWNEEKYRFSPIIYFDLSRDINSLYGYLKRRGSNLYVRSILDFDMNLMEECTWYYRLLAGHFSGLIDLRKDIDLNTLNVLNKAIVSYLFRSDIEALIHDKSIIKSEQLLHGLQNTILFGNQKNIVDIDLVE